MLKNPPLHVPSTTTHDCNDLIEHCNRVVVPDVPSPVRFSSYLNLQQLHVCQLIAIQEGALRCDPNIPYGRQRDLFLGVNVQEGPPCLILHNCYPLTIGTNPVFVSMPVLRTRNKCSCQGGVQRHQRGIDTLHNFQYSIKPL